MYKPILLESLIEVLKETGYSFEDLIDILESFERKLVEEKYLNIYIPKNERLFFERFKELQLFTLQKGTNKVISYIKLLHTMNKLHLSVNPLQLTAEKFKYFHVFKLASQIEEKFDLTKGTDTKSASSSYLVDNITKLIKFYVLNYNILSKLSKFHENSTVPIDIELYDSTSQLTKELIEKISKSENIDDPLLEKLERLQKFIQDLDHGTYEIFSRLRKTRNLITHSSNTNIEDNIKTLKEKFKAIVNQVKSIIPIIRTIIHQLSRNRIITAHEEAIIYEILEQLEMFNTVRFSRHINYILRKKNEDKNLNNIKIATDEIKKFGMPLQELAKYISKIYHNYYETLDIKDEVFHLIPVLINLYIIQKKPPIFSYLRKLREIIIINPNVLDILFLFKAILYAMVVSLDNIQKGELLKLINTFTNSNNLNFSKEISFIQEIRENHGLYSIIKQTLGNDSEKLLNKYLNILKFLQNIITTEDENKTDIA